MRDNRYIDNAPRSVSTIFATCCGMPGRCELFDIASTGDVSVGASTKLMKCLCR